MKVTQAIQTVVQLLILGLLIGSQFYQEDFPPDRFQYMEVHRT